eukprot:TRINITY_DN55823_c0_g1_i1.p1 TRINITY_DN55823_c0_g1~~TRINITY_DN55823_c0_g1_i1.p1  ORF type:complete len:506 (+),score=105.75 TRINITY_DN55823_c0_g1_i1:31-1518(+)
MAANGEINTAVQSVRRTFNSGRTLPLAFRRQQLQRLYDLVNDNSDKLCDALKKDLGKPKSEALLADIGLVQQEIAHTVAHLNEWTAPKYPNVDLVNKFDGCQIRPEPYGVVLIIAPWNYPVQLCLGPLVGVIAAGNAAVIKPSEITEHTTALFTELIPQYLDTSLYRVVTGGPQETQELLRQRFDYICYTGSSSIGKIVMEAAAKHLTPVTLELGGKSPVIIDRKTNLPVAARRVMWGKCLNAGQTCIAPDYVLCPKSLQADFVKHLKAARDEYYGQNVQASPDLARIVNARHFQRVVGLMKSGGKIAFGGSVDESTRYVEPTVLVDVPVDAPIMQEEIFGPLLPIIDCESVDLAIDFINDREKPLALYMFSDDKANVEKVIQRTASGGVCVNDVLMHATPMQLPFGGVGNSGMGSWHGKYTFDTFSHNKPIMHKNCGLESVNNIRYAPYTDKKFNMLRKLLFKKPNFSGRSSKLPLILLATALLASILYLRQKN